MDLLRNEINKYVIHDITKITMDYYYTPTRILETHCRLGNFIALQVIDEIMGIPKEISKSCFTILANRGFNDMALFLLHKGHIQVQKALEIAIEKNNRTFCMDIIKTFYLPDNLSKIGQNWSDLNNWSDCLYYICQLKIHTGDIINLAHKLKRKGARLNRGLEGAAKAGKENLVEQLINIGAWNLDLGLTGACRGKSEHMIRYFMRKGAEHCFNCNYEEHKKKKKFTERKNNMETEELFSDSDESVSDSYSESD